MKAKKEKIRIIKVCIAVVLIAITFLIINVYAAGTEREIMDEKTLVRMTATTAKLKNDVTKLDVDILKTEIENLVGTNIVTVTDKSSDIILVKFLKTENEYEVNKISDLGGGYYPEDPPEIPDEPDEPEEPVTPEPGQLPSTEYTTPYMPTNFHYVEGNLADGIVIADELGNEYVWVEVPRNATVYNDSSDSAEDDLNADGTIDDTTNDDILSYNPDSLTVAQYNAIETELKEYTKTYRNNTLYVDEFYSTAQHGFADANAYNQQKYKMLKSVFKNGGFYVGRYETGIASAPKTSGSDSVEIPSETPVIKKNAYPYNYVTNKQAQKLASTKFDGGGYETSLLFGVQWDLVLKYMETKAVEKGANQTTIISKLNSDSTSWGNYSNNNWTIENTDSKYSTNGISWTSGLYNGTGNKGNTSTSILLSTGADASFSKQNIYDIAGNVHEWTLEYTSRFNTPCAHRGGSYGNVGSIPARHRENNGTTDYYTGAGFRVSLY